MAGVNKERLIGRYNWFHRVMAYPMPEWDKDVKQAMFDRFIEFNTAVRDFGYKFETHIEDENGVRISVATDIVPIKKVS